MLLYIRRVRRMQALVRRYRAVRRVLPEAVEVGHNEHWSAGTARRSRAKPAENDSVRYQRSLLPRVFTRLAAIIAAAALLAPLIARADTHITLDLPSSRAPQPPAASVSGQNPTEQPPAAEPPDRRGGMRRGGASANQRVVGRLGLARSAAPIRAQRTSRARLLTRVAAGTYLALTTEVGDWYGVLMADRSTGWMRKADVEPLSYEVVANGPDPARNPDAEAMNNPFLNEGQRALLQAAYAYLGVPYRYGGTSTNGMDCSAFVQRVFGHMGLQLPRTAREQYAVGAPVDTSQLQAADRVYFADKSGRITHTGIYIGNGYFIHSSSSRKGVAINRLQETMYSRMYVGAKR